MLTAIQNARVHGHGVSSMGFAFLFQVAGGHISGVWIRGSSLY
jgi:hypothetical protein